MGALNNKNTYYDYKKHKKVPLPPEASAYFKNIHKVMRTNYNQYDDNENNYSMAQERKSFTRAQVEEDTSGASTNWLEFLQDWLEEKSEEYPWASPLYDVLDAQNFINENKFQSLLFYKEYSFKTLPNALKKEQTDDLENNEDLLGSDLEAIDNIGESMGKNFTELDITDNLGGSFMSMNTVDLSPDDPAIQYKQGRVLCKKYVRVFSEHLNQNKDHPIMVVINLFAEEFSKTVNTRTQELRNLLNQGVEEETFTNRTNEISEVITKELQQFIIFCQSAVKLFYCRIIDYNCFSQEKDEIINLITSIVFKDKRVYDCMYELYDLATSSVKRNLEYKFHELGNLTPQELGIDVKFCLDEKTLENQKEILAKKRKEKDMKEKEKEGNKDDNAIIAGDTIIEKEEDEDEEEKDLNKSSGDLKIDDNKLDIRKEKEDNIIENSPLYANNNIDVYNNFSSRYTVNSFNNKTFNFPKLHKNLRDTIGIQNEYVASAMKTKENLPKSYASAIELLKSIRKFRTPFEKMMIIASISDEITECVNNFWNDMNKYIKSTYLNIEADELMTIFLFIIIKSQMPELTIFAKMIKNFTSSTTRGTMIGYYYTTLEASIAYIEELRDLNEIVKREQQLKGARESIRQSLAHFGMNN
jgi:hypothetical protein